MTVLEDKDVWTFVAEMNFRKKSAQSKSQSSSYYLLLAETSVDENKLILSRVFLK